MTSICSVYKGAGFVMLNFAIRYKPILPIYRRSNLIAYWKLVVAQKALAMFGPAGVVGADIAFKRRPLHQPVGASAVALPFGDQSWPIVVSCDTLEHMPPPARPTMLTELMRVTQNMLILAFPSGAAASDCYHNLSQTLSHPLPDWLNDHITLGLPNAEQMARCSTRRKMVRCLELARVRFCAQHANALGVTPLGSGLAPMAHCVSVGQRLHHK